MHFFHFLLCTVNNVMMIGCLLPVYPSFNFTILHNLMMIVSLIYSLKIKNLYNFMMILSQIVIHLHLSTCCSLIALAQAKPPSLALDIQHFYALTHLHWRTYTYTTLYHCVQAYLRFNVTLCFTIYILITFLQNHPR